MVNLFRPELPKVIDIPTAMLSFSEKDTLSLQPQNPGMMNNLAYFLINKDRNIDEGLELVKHVLQHLYLHILW